MSEDGTVRLRASELNDFIGPSLACIKPVKEIKPKKQRKKVRSVCVVFSSSLFFLLAPKAHADRKDIICARAGRQGPDSD